MISSNSRRERWAGVVAAQEASGLSAARWCRDNEVETNSFYNWRKRLSGASCAGRNEATSTDWLELGPNETNSAPTGLTLRIGRICIDLTPGFDQRLLCDVLGVLESTC